MTPQDKPMTCEELELYLADMLDGELPEGRMETFLAHVEHCESCRREWQAWQEQEGQLHRYFAREREGLEKAIAEQILRTPVVQVAPRRSPLRWVAWAAAALVFIALGAGTWHVYRNAVPSGNQVLATVRQIEGRVQLLEGGAYKPLTAGAELRQNQRIKVTEGGYAALEYPNKNILEVRSGTQLALREFRDHTEVAMDRGQVWAHLHVKPKKRFVISAGQLRAVATGTVYSVQEGVGQTVVAVAEGTVKVEGTNVAPASVSAGDIYCSRPEGEAGPVSQLTNWSRYPQDLAALAKEETPREEATAAKLSTPVQAAATPVAAAAVPAAAPAKPVLKDLLEALPGDLRAFIEIRNWKALTSAFSGSAYAALTQEPHLRQWWARIDGSKYLKEFNDELRLLELVQIAKSLDGQVVLAVVPPQGHFLLLADCRTHEVEMRARIEQLFRGQADLTQTKVRARTAQEWSELRQHIAVADGRLIVSSDPALVRDAQGRLGRGEPGNFKASPFYKKTASEVRDPNFMAAVDMNGIWPAEGQDKNFDNTLRLLGLRGLDTFVISPSFVGRGLNQAARLSFASNRFGAMNWLAEPGPMRGCDFFSSDVHLFAALRLRSARQMFFDYMIFRYSNEGEETLRRIRAFFDQHEPLFDAFGGEVAVGVDSPLIPVPNVKIAIELTDRPTFERELALVLKTVIAEWEARGKVALTQDADYKGFKIYSLTLEGVPMQPAWAFVNDFVVIGPGPMFVQNSIDVYTAGQSIGRDPHLTSLFPSGAGTHFSLLFYQDVAKAIPGLLNNTLFTGVPKESKAMVPDLAFLERYRAPGIAYASAGPKSIDLFLNTPTGIDFNMGMAVPLVANWLAPHLGFSPAADAYAEAVVGLNQLKAAVEKFKAVNGRWPSSLSELAHPVGKYIDQIPKDPFGKGSGETLRLIPDATGQGLILYSLGPDGVDQQGKVELKPDQNLTDPGDIVIRVQ